MCVPGNAMHEFGEANGRKHRALVARGGDDLVEHLRDVIASAFRGDDNTRV